MKGVFVRLEKDEIKNLVADMLEANASLVHLSSATSSFKNLEKLKIKFEKEFLMAAEELDFETEKLKSLMPEVEVVKTKPSPRIKPMKLKKTKRSMHEAELESIRKRLESLRMR